MRDCPDCAVRIEGEWARCPLCGTRVGADTPPKPSPYPDVPLRFSRRRVLVALFLTSLAVIGVSFLAQLLFPRDLGGLRLAWFGLVSMWLVVLMAVRKRRNVAKNTVYLVVVVGLICVYWDYLAGWSGWSVTYAVPIVCGCSILALLIIVRVTRIEVGEHIVYSGLAVLLGLVPLVFLLLGWVTDPVPSAICGALSVIALAAVHVRRGGDVRHELAKRLHL